MKTVKFISLALTFSLLIMSCGNGKSKRRQSNLLPPLKIEIPAEIEGDTELVSLIQQSETAINEFSDNVEIMIEDLLPIIEENKTEEELGMFEKLKVGKAMLEFASNSTHCLEAMESFNNYTEQKEAAGEVLNDNQLRAIATVTEAFDKRMKEIDKKFEEITKDLDK